MTSKLNAQFYFVSPMEVVRVTSDNLQEAAEWCGGKVATVESRKVPGRIDSYVWVPTPKGTQISWAFPGMFITKRMVVTLKNELKETFAVYRRDYFDKNYFDTPQGAVDATWERAAAEKKKAKKSQQAKEQAAEAIVKEAKQPNIQKMMGGSWREPVAIEQVLEAAEPPVVEVNLTDNATPKLEESKQIITELAEAAGITTWVHDHKSTERCDENDCHTDRFNDGVHAFTDTQIDSADDLETQKQKREALIAAKEARGEHLIESPKVEFVAPVPAPPKTSKVVPNHLKAVEEVPVEDLRAK